MTDPENYEACVRRIMDINDKGTIWVHPAAVVDKPIFSNFNKGHTTSWNPLLRGGFPNKIMCLLWLSPEGKSDLWALETGTAPSFQLSFILAQFS